MKKVVIGIVALFLCGAGAVQAQIVSSRSTVLKTTYEKKRSDTQWFMRAGVSFMKLTKEEGTSIAPGYNFVIGFQKSIRDNGAYWGMELGLDSRGGNLEDGYDYYYDDYDDSFVAHAVQFSPFTFGWEIGLTDKIKLDPHMGIFASADYICSTGEEILDYLFEDAGINLGIGIWFGRFNIDFTWQRGLVPPQSYYTWDDDRCSNLLLRIGVAF